MESKGFRNTVQTDLMRKQDHTKSNHTNWPPIRQNVEQSVRQSDTVYIYYFCLSLFHLTVSTSMQNECRLCVNSYSPQ